MQAANESSPDEPTWQTILAEPAARLLTNPNEANWISPFLGRETTIKAAAEELGIPMLGMYRAVKRLEQMGLLNVSRSEARKGRAVHYYRSSSDAYFVPYSAAPEGTLEHLLENADRSWRKNVVNSLAQSFWEAQENSALELGLRLYRCDEHVYFVHALGSGETGSAGLTQSFLAVDAPAIRHEWVMLHLSFARAKELQQRMAALLNEYKKDDQGRAYLACVTLAPSGSSQ
jgi:DNA-binding MarR family transcriptional regulator